MHDDHPLVLVCSADDGFAKPLAVTLYSALSNYRGQRTMQIYIVDGGIHPANRARINRIVEKHRTTVEWIAPNFEALRRLNISERYPTTVYLRLLIPSLLPDGIEKAIYLDSDILVDDNIAELWDSDLDGKAFLAVQDKGVPTVGSRWGLRNYRDLGLDPSTIYFNSGVLVFDLRAWRECGLAGRVIEYIAAHPDQTGMGDQHAMNAVLARDWGALNDKWNQQVWAWEGHDAGKYQRGILHFVFTAKPWNPAGVHWTNIIYDRYMKQCGWYGALQWWAYYVPLTVRRQHVLLFRATHTLNRSHARPDSSVRI